MTGLEGALCRGQWWLFDSTDPADHAEARRLCHECPAVHACAQLLHAEKSAPLAQYGGPVGTWAGRLLGRNPGRTLPREHGTERGYQQHRHRRDVVCQPCKLAHAEHGRQRYAKVAS